MTRFALLSLLAVSVACAPAPDGTDSGDDSDGTDSEQGTIEGDWNVDEAYSFDGAPFEEIYEPGYSMTLTIRATLSGSLTLKSDGDSIDLPVSTVLEEDGSYTLTADIADARCVVAGDLMDCTDRKETDWQEDGADFPIINMALSRR